MPIKPFLVISTELIGADPGGPYGSAVSVWASVASVKFLDGTQIVICNPRMEIPDASVSIRGSLWEAPWWSRLGSN